jgi:uncharacterized repeat protein (TIGR01451 family)
LGGLFAAAGPAQADVFITITGPSGPVAPGTSYTLTMTVPNAASDSNADHGLPLYAALTGTAATFTAASADDPAASCTGTGTASLSCFINRGGNATDTFTLTVLPTMVGTVTATATVPDFGGSDSTTTTIANPSPAPTVTSVSPNTGPPSGGNTVIITGTNLTGATAISFGVAGNATAVSCTATSCAATAPPWGTGTVDVQVTTPGGTSAANPGDHYTYAAADLAITLTATGYPGLSGHIDYTVTITNNGPSALTSATIHATLPSPMTATSSTCTTTGGVTCTLGALASGASTTRIFTAPIGLLTLGVPYAVTATRTTSTPADQVPGNDSATRDCTVLTSLIISCF